jgi:hypothetical protein
VVSPCWIWRQARGRRASEASSSINGSSIAISSHARHCAAPLPSQRARWDRQAVDRPRAATVSQHSSVPRVLAVTPHRPAIERSDLLQPRPNLIRRRIRQARRCRKARPWADSRDASAEARNLLSTGRTRRPHPSPWLALRGLALQGCRPTAPARIVNHTSKTSLGDELG